MMYLPFNGNSILLVLRQLGRPATLGEIANRMVYRYHYITEDVMLNAIDFLLEIGQIYGLIVAKGHEKYTIDESVSNLVVYEVQQPSPAVCSARLKQNSKFNQSATGIMRSTSGVDLGRMNTYNMYYGVLNHYNAIMNGKMANRIDGNNNLNSSHGAINNNNNNNPNTNNNNHNGNHNNNNNGNNDMYDMDNFPDDVSDYYTDALIAALLDLDSDSEDNYSM